MSCGVGESECLMEAHSAEPDARSDELQVSGEGWTPKKEVKTTREGEVLAANH
jgi:hypothetical protein